MATSSKKPQFQTIQSSKNIHKIDGHQWIFLILNKINNFFLDSASKATSLPYSEQESQEAKAGYDTKPDARSPCQIEDDDDPKGKEAVAAKPDARIPCQEEDDRPNGKTASDTKPDARVPSQVEDDDDPKNRAQSDSKPDARLPSQVEYDDDPKRRAQSDTKPDARVPSQVEDDDDLKNRVLPDTKTDARVPSQVEVDEDPALRSRTKLASQMLYQVDDEDDVFESKGIKGDLLIVLPNLGHFLTAMSIFFPSFF